MSFSFSFSAYADDSDTMFRGRVKKGEFKCTSAMLIADEILKAEFAGKRWRDAKSSCFTDLEFKYIHISKHPDESVATVVKVKPETLKISEPKFNKDYYMYEAGFVVESVEGKMIKYAISFMLNTEQLGQKKPFNGCALTAAMPKAALVSESCL